jgi:hypothetical protein
MGGEEGRGGEGEAHGGRKDTASPIAGASRSAAATSNGVPVMQSR